MFEHRRDHVLPLPRFIRRVGRHLLWALLMVLIAISVGTIGYRTAGELGWLDSFLNASMILSGMGPVDPLKTSAGKVFAALYALFSGVVFIGVMGVVLAPWVHRLMHVTHLDDQ